MRISLRSSMDDRKKKIAIVSGCSLILLAMVVGLILGGQQGENKNVTTVSASQKAKDTMCNSVDYPSDCYDALKSAGNDTSDPKKLIGIAFDSAVSFISKSFDNSTVVQAAEKEPRGKDALDNCRALAQKAVEDLQRSSSKFADFDVMNFDSMLADMKTWLSASITNLETCVEGFDGIPGDEGKKLRESGAIVRDALTDAMRRTSNGLAMVTQISTFLEPSGPSDHRRRLLSEAPVTGYESDSDDLPSWIDLTKRMLLVKRRRQINADLIVAKDGTGKYKTINEALHDVPKNSNKTFVLYVKKGVYEEKVNINSSMINLLLIGDGPTKTKITGSLNFIDGVGTYQTATFAVQGDYFMAKDIGFENSAGPEKHQAVAVRVSADKAIFQHCRFDGYQDTLYAHTYRQFYTKCTISGTIDFIFGDSASVFQSCIMEVRKPLDNQMNIVTAQGRKDVRQPTGLVLQNCSFVAADEYHPFRHQLKSYLGRPWKEYSRTIIMESFLDDLIDPEGWLPWMGDFGLATLFYTEYNNRGPAADKSKRVKWPGVRELPQQRIARFTAAPFLDGDRWVKTARVPYSPGFMFPPPKENPNITYSPVVPEEVKDLGNNKDKDAYKPPITPPPPPPPPQAPPPEEDHDNNDDHDNHHKHHKDISLLPPISDIAASPFAEPPVVPPTSSYIAAAPGLGPLPQGPAALGPLPQGPAAIGPLPQGQATKSHRFSNFLHQYIHW